MSRLHIYDADGMPVPTWPDVSIRGEPGVGGGIGVNLNMGEVAMVAIAVGVWVIALWGTNLIG